MVVNLRDGTPVQLTMSDTHAGPDGKPGCQRTSMNVPWFRLPGGEWERAPRPLNTARLMELARVSDDRHEFLQLLDMH